MDEPKEMKQSRKLVTLEGPRKWTSWVRKLGISSNRLRGLVKRFGNSFGKIRKNA